jgi:hypothetical protein
MDQRVARITVFKAFCLSVAWRDVKHLWLADYRIVSVPLAMHVHHFHLMKIQYIWLEQCPSIYCGQWRGSNSVNQEIVARTSQNSCVSWTHFIFCHCFVYVRRREGMDGVTKERMLSSKLLCISKIVLQDALTLSKHKLLRSNDCSRVLDKPRTRNDEKSMASFCSQLLVRQEYRHHQRFAFLSPR